MLLISGSDCARRPLPIGAGGGGDGEEARCGGCGDEEFVLLSPPQEGLLSPKSSGRCMAPANTMMCTITKIKGERMREINRECVSV